MIRNKGPEVVGSVERALTLLTVAQSQDSVGVQEAARLIDVAPSTAHRLLSTLQSSGYLRQNDDRTYRLGPRMVRPGLPDRVPRLMQVARPHLEELHARIDETVHLVVLTGQDIRPIDGLESSQLLRVGLHVGTIVPAHAAAAGKAMLAEMPVAEVAALYAGGLPEWPQSKLASLEDLKSELSRTRHLGYGITNESQVGVTALGTSIAASSLGMWAGLSVAVPTARLDAPAIKRLIDPVLAATAAIRSDLEVLQG